MPLTEYGMMYTVDGQLSKAKGTRVKVEQDILYCIGTKAVQHICIRHSRNGWHKTVSICIMTKLQRATNNIHDWNVRWKIKINAEKSNSVLIRGLRRRQSEDITLDGDIIQEEQGQGGGTMDKNLTYK